MNIPGLAEQPIQSPKFVIEKRSCSWVSNGPEHILLSGPGCDSKNRLLQANRVQNSFYQQVLGKTSAYPCGRQNRGDAEDCQ
ncbi:hypothetical protein Pla144_00340 [Bythopirellula polymerisocia]|uniref:Uncharacterized protein n=1 Tax=Bythopirellula polymerisocia TaxID=2528003 RepID=A0A5C6CXY2_9BACT|nr:hypothetical protein Pla144_00340 [Bythopirellula polymerisocia]